MLFKFGRLAGIGLAGVALSGVAHAADEASVTTGALSAKLGGEFRSELIYDDHGLDKLSGGDTPTKTTDIGVTNANILLHGNYNKDTEFGFRFNLLHPDTQGPLDYGYGTHWFTKMMGFSIGKMKVMQGGWDTLEGSYRSHVTGAYSENLVYPEFDNTLAFHLKVAGQVSLQLLNDVSTTAGTGEWNKGSHPTWVLGWLGELGPIKPLVDIGSYDNNKSRWIDVGVKTQMAGLNATLDLYQNSRMHKGTDPANGKSVDWTDTATAITLNVAYEVKNVATPWLFFSTYDNKQADKTGFSADAKVNTATADASGKWTYDFDDNGVTWGIGADLNMMGKGWTPFVALVNQSGKFNKNPADKTSAEETRSDMQVKLGVLGEI